MANINQIQNAQLVHRSDLETKSWSNESHHYCEAVFQTGFGNFAEYIMIGCWDEQARNLVSYQAGSVFNIGYTIRAKESKTQPGKWYNSTSLREMVPVLQAQQQGMPMQYPTPAQQQAAQAQPMQFGQFNAPAAQPVQAKPQQAQPTQGQLPF